MREVEIVSLVVGLLEAITGNETSSKGTRLWAGSVRGNSMIAWNPRGEEAYKLAGRLRLMSGPRGGRV